MFPLKRNHLSGARRLDGMYFPPVRQVEQRAAALADKGKPVILLSSQAPDFPVPSPIREAAVRAIRANRSGYAPSRGTPELREAIARQLLQTDGVPYDPAGEILVTTGGAEAIHSAFLSLLNPGDEVILFPPASLNCENLIAMCGATAVEIPLEPADGFQIPVEQVCRQLTPKTPMMVLSSPCSPTGVVCSREVLTGLARLAMEHDLLVFSDKTYSHIVYDDVRPLSIASLPDMKEHTIVMGSFSMNFSMPGRRLGYLAADARLLPGILKIHQYTTTCAPTFLQDALAQAMNDPLTQTELQAMVRTLDARRHLLMDSLRGMEGLAFSVPQGTFHLFADVHGTGMDGDDFARRLLEEHQVACVPGSMLGGHCGDFVRISYAVGEEDLREALRHMAQFLHPEGRESL